jgi:hypothetical protein
MHKLIINVSWFDVRAEPLISTRLHARIVFHSLLSDIWETVEIYDKQYLMNSVPLPPFAFSVVTTHRSCSRSALLMMSFDDIWEVFAHKFLFSGGKLELA